MCVRERERREIERQQVTSRFTERDVSGEEGHTLTHSHTHTLTRSHTHTLTHSRTVAHMSRSPEGGEGVVQGLGRGLSAKMQSPGRRESTEGRQAEQRIILVSDPRRFQAPNSGMSVEEALAMDLSRHF